MTQLFSRPLSELDQVEWASIDVKSEKNQFISALTELRRCSEGEQPDYYNEIWHLMLFENGGDVWAAAPHLIPFIINQLDKNVTWIMLYLLCQVAAPAYSEINILSTTDLLEITASEDLIWKSKLHPDIYTGIIRWLPFWLEARQIMLSAAEVFHSYLRDPDTDTRFFAAHLLSSLCMEKSEIAVWLSERLSHETDRDVQQVIENGLAQAQHQAASGSNDIIEGQP